MSTYFAENRSVFVGYGLDRSQVYTVKIYVSLEHRVDHKRPRARILRPAHLAHANDLSLVFQLHDFVCRLVVLAKTYAFYLARGVIQHKLDKRQSFAARLGIVGFVAFVFVGFFSIAKILPQSTMLSHADFTSIM